MASAGGGSSTRATAAVSGNLSSFLRRLGDEHTPGSLLDIGCGWGEWIPSLLLRAGLRLRYLGIDIADQPIKALQKRFSEQNNREGLFEFAAKDAVKDPLPRGFDAALVRHVFQHLTLADALSLLRNVRASQPKLLVISSWPGAPNRDLSGSSAFDSVAPGEVFPGYDLRKPPFSLPEPLEAWREQGREQLLVYPIQALDAIDAI